MTFYVNIMRIEMFLNGLFSFICKVDVVELGGSDELCGKGYELSLFLFSDVLEISKRRSATKGLTLRSPSTMSLRHAAAANACGTLAPGQSNHTHHKTSLKHINLVCIRHG
jgi:hypothetical protein